MLATQHPARLPQNAPSASVLLRMALDSLVVLGTLLACVLLFEPSFRPPYAFLALIAFSLTFPGSAPIGSGALDMLRDIAASWLGLLALLLLLGWATGTLDAFDARVLAAWSIATPLALFAAQRAVPPLLNQVIARTGRTVVIAGANELGCRLASQIEAEPMGDRKVAGYFDDRALERVNEASRGRILGSIEQLAEYVRRHRVDIIYITLPVSAQPRMLKLLDDLHDTTASIYYAPDIFLFDLIQARLDQIGGIPVVAVCETPFYGVDGLVKRLSDVAIAGLALILAAPLMLALAIGVKLSSPGPVLFKQRRYGLDGREIVVYKFRTMRVQEDGDHVRQATRGDSRVTPFGAFLRRTSLDEFPQFINVLQGRMSVVGPRPHAVAHNELYRKLIKGYMIRHKVKPGITGWAQVNGLRGETDTLEKMAARIEYDLEYLHNWSLRFDRRIIARTVLVVLRGSNAY